MRYLDANVFIYGALYSGEKGDNARKILMELPYSEKSITSTLTLDEVVWVIWKETDRKTGTIAKSSDEYKHSQKDLNQNRMTVHC